MPTLTDSEQIIRLTEQVIAIGGRPSAIASKLNASTQEGIYHVALGSDAFLTTLSEHNPSAYKNLEDAIVEGSSEAASLILGWLGYPGYVEVEEGTEGRRQLEAAVVEGHVTQAGLDAIVKAAEAPKMTGPSWAREVGIGQVTEDVVKQVMKSPRRMSCTNCQHLSVTWDESGDEPVFVEADCAAGYPEPGAMAEYDSTRFEEIARTCDGWTYEE